MCLVRKTTIQGAKVLLFFDITKFFYKKMSFWTFKHYLLYFYQCKIIVYRLLYTCESAF